MMKNCINFYSNILLTSKNLLCNITKIDEINEKLINKRENIIKNLNQYEIKINKIKKYYEIFKNIDNQNSIKSMIIINAKVQTQCRVICGTSENYFQPIYEISLFFNTFWNCPYIPGSSIKGCIKASCRKVCKNDEIIDKIFGSNNGIGKAIFLDAYPFIKVTKKSDNEIVFSEYKNANNKKDDDNNTNNKENNNKFYLNDVLEGEIINKHIDDETFFKNGEIISPNPLIFLAIKPEVPFCFLILLRKELEDYEKDILLQGIVRAFEFEGIGAKTNLGYGRFKIEEMYEVIKNE